VTLIVALLSVIKTLEYFGYTFQNIISTGTEVFVGYAVAQLVEALRYKPEGRGFDYRWGHWNFSVI
jgi:hypothetical protein